MSDLVIVAQERVEDTPQAQAQRDKVAKFMSTARSRFQTVVAAESELRQNQLDDKRFAASDQWEPRAITERRQDDRPMITVNRIRQFIRLVTNQMRQAQIAIKVLPNDDQADVKTAEVYQGIIRHIEDQSDAQAAYATAGDDQTTVGRGYWKIIAEYSHDRSFTQDLRIKRVRNCFSVYVDPAHTELDGSDMNYAFEVEDIPKEEYLARYGELGTDSSLHDFEAIGNQAPDWMPTGKVRVAMYWFVEMYKETIHLIRWTHSGDEEVVTDQERANLQQALDRLPAPPADSGRQKVGFTIRTSRQVDARRVKWALINGLGIIEGNADRTDGKEWPGRWIPIIPVIGDEIDIDGKVDLRGMTRDAKDTQRLLNWEKTMLAEALSLAPLSQWVGYEGQFDGHQTEWKEANRRRRPYLTVRPFTLDGKVVPLPQRITSEPPIGGIVTAIQQDENDLQAIMGLYQESLGKRSSSSQSGKAISALQQQGEIATSNFQDNMGRSIRCSGRYLVDLIPHYYDALRVMRIIGEDETPRTVMVHRDQPEVPETLPEGVQGIYNLGAGRYDVTVSTGPAMPTKRKEALEALNQFVQVYPAAFPILGDIIVGNMDWPGAQAAAARLKKAVPPQFLDPEKDGGPAPIPPEAQQQMQQLEGLVKELQQQLQEAESGLQAKKLETDSRERIASETIASDERIAAAKLSTDIIRDKEKQHAEAEIVQLKATVAHIQRLLDHIIETRDKAINHAHEVDQAQQGRAHELGMAAHRAAHETLARQAEPPAEPGA